MADDDVKALTERYSGTIKDHSGEIIKIEDWSESLPIWSGKKTKAVTFFSILSAAPNSSMNWKDSLKSLKMS